MWDWMKLAQNFDTGSTIPQFYKSDFNIIELGNDGFTPLNAWLCTGCWVKKVKMPDMKRSSNENTIEEVTLSVDTVVLL
jgi:hypothetical protein